jgi:hypothetical protein
LERLRRIPRIGDHHDERVTRVCKEQVTHIGEVDDPLDVKPPEQITPELPPGPLRREEQVDRQN